MASTSLILKTRFETGDCGAGGTQDDNQLGVVLASAAAASLPQLSVCRPMARVRRAISFDVSVIPSAGVSLGAGSSQVPP